MTRARFLPVAVLAALVALPMAALAQDNSGIKFQVGGGLVTFPNEVQVNNGGAYGAMIGVQPYDRLGIELGYQGAAYGEAPLTENLDVTQNVDAVENGGYAAVKVSPFGVRTFEPYVLGGVGISNLNVTSPQAQGALQDDTFGKAPVGAGFDLHLGDFLLGARGTYNFIFNNDAAFAGTSPNADDQFIGQANIGAQF